MKGRIRIAIACTGLLLVAAVGARAQSTSRETGSLTVGGYFVWVRATNAKTVELYVARGFRDAFARAHDMDAAKLQQWIDSVRAVSPVAADDSAQVDAQLRGTALGADVTMLRRVGGTFSGLRLLVSGEDPIKMVEPTARDFIAMLDSAARVTRELSVPPPTIMASMPMQIAAPSADAPAANAPAANAPAPTAVAPAPVAIVASATATPVVATSVRTSVAPVVHTSAPLLAHTSVATSVHTSEKASQPAAAPEVTVASSMGASVAEAPPELVLPMPSQVVAPVGREPDLSPLPTPAIPPAVRVRAATPLVKAAHMKIASTPVVTAPVVAVRVVAAPVVAAPVDSTPVVVVYATPAPGPIAPAPQSPAPAVAPAPAPDTVAPPHPEVPADKLIRTPLGPFTIPGALLSDRDKQAQYCYTQLGLKYNPDLKGEITVKLSLGGDGAVQDAVVTKRSWQGISAGEVESCVRALAHDWTFASNDPAVTGGAKLLTFSFTP